jgi:hypothetical protein
MGVKIALVIICGLFVLVTTLKTRNKNKKNEE